MTPQHTLPVQTRFIASNGVMLRASNSHLSAVFVSAISRRTLGLLQGCLGGIVSVSQNRFASVMLARSAAVMFAIAVAAVGISPARAQDAKDSKEAGMSAQAAAQGMPGMSCMGRMAAMGGMGGGTGGGTTASGRPHHPPGAMCAVHAAGPQARISVEHQAQQEVSNDLASITLFAEFRDKEANSASQRAAIATQQAMARLQSDSSISEKRSSLQTWNDYGPDGKIAGWRARAEIVIEGKDFAALGKAGGRLSPEFSYAGVSYRLSHEARQKEEQALMTRAVAAWREKANTVVGALGYANGFEAVDVTVRTSSDAGVAGPQMRMAQPMLMAASADGAPAAALEGGRSKVTVTISGVVRAK